MAEEVGCVVIGAGVVGLAVARELARRGRETWVLEAADAIGTGISARNSGVIHAGIYYPRDSLKARLCVRGRQLLYAYCAARGVEHRRCGKLIVATEAAQEAGLEALRSSAARNGVTDLVALTGAQARALEPELHCTAALLSPSTGIVDAHGLMQALQADLETAGGRVVTRAPIQGGDCRGPGIRLDVGGEGAVELQAHCVVNCAGLGAQAVSQRLAGVPAASIPPLRFAKGNYFALAGPSPFRHLVYPMPEPGGLGIHLTLDLAGRARFGPDVEWVEGPSFGVDPARAGRFAEAIRRYWPGLPPTALQPDYAGIRPKLGAPHTGPADFVISGPAQHGVPGLVSLYGIESPGLTSALALAEQVAALMEG